MRLIATLFATAAMLVAGPVIAAKERPNLVGAVAAPSRPAEDVALDAGRKPAEVLAFMGLKTGDKVADIMAGNGYYTDIIAHAVGPKGHVTAYDPKQFSDGDAKAAAAWAALLGRRANVTRTLYPFEAFDAPGNTYDFVMLHLDYHDLYWESAKFKVPRTDPAAFVATLYKAVKPGGTVAVIDHVALPGDTRATVEKMHRIDPETVKADFVKAGFVLDGESDLLRNPADDHSKMVFDPAIRGQTDRFVFRFKKPRKG